MGRAHSKNASDVVLATCVRIEVSLPPRAAFSMFNMFHGTGPLNCEGPKIEKIQVVKRKSVSTYLDYFFFII